MTDPAPPSWVTKRDGRLVPFEADKISRALFTASDGLGQPDAFLARELADSVVHFLALDSEGQTPTTQRIADVVVQVVRELGQPALAQAFAQQRLDRPLSRSLNQSLHSLYTRDLSSAQDAGLLTLVGADTPGELAGCVLGAPLTLTGDLTADLLQARQVVGQLVALDGLEYLGGSLSPADLVAAVLHGLARTGLTGVVNLNGAQPPSWAHPLAAGPLFAATSDTADVRTRCDQLLVPFLTSGHLARIDWHLGSDDFTPAARPRLLEVVSHALDGAPIGFVFDRPRRPVALAEGLDRGHPAVLLVAGLELPALLRQPGMLADAERCRMRLGSLVRLALSAAVQKRDFLRRLGRSASRVGADVTSGFLLDRARLVVVPVGLDEVVRQLTGWGLANGGPSLELGKQLVGRIREVLEQDGRLVQMDACIDGPFSGCLGEGERSASEGRWIVRSPATLEEVAGLTPWDGHATIRSQLRAGAVLHASAEQGTLALFLGETGLDAASLANWLEGAWRQTGVVRVRLVRPG